MSIFHINDIQISNSWVICIRLFGFWNFISARMTSNSCGNRSEIEFRICPISNGENIASEGACALSDAHAHCTEGSGECWGTIKHSSFSFVNAHPSTNHAQCCLTSVIGRDREPGPPGWGNLRWESKVLRDSDHWVITLQTADQPSRQRGRPTETRPQISDSNIPTGSNIWSQVPRGCSIPRHTDWLTDRQSWSNLEPP
jgi:hypothetical protein